MRGLILRVWAEGETGGEYGGGQELDEDRDAPAPSFSRGLSPEAHSITDPMIVRVSCEEEKV